ncbi:hypothetical protein Godav_018220, partial [Gossypium davidsonii]|nr:hypothetical protein [Gossypium davidsonii]
MELLDGHYDILTLIGYLV